MAKINVHTSVDDLRSGFKGHSIEGYAENDIEQAIAEETINRNRISVIKLLNRVLRMKKLGAKRL